MTTDFKLLFYIKKTEVKADGTCPIMGRISIGKTMAQFSTKRTANVPLWDTRANRMSDKSTTAVAVNRTLDKLTVSIYSHYQKLIRFNGSATALEVKNTFLGMASAKQTLVRYYQKHNEEFTKCVGVNREKSTAVQYEYSLNHLVRFIPKNIRFQIFHFLSWISSLSKYLIFTYA